MHFSDFYAIVERDHAIQNPTSSDKLMRLAEYCRVADGQRVLDIGCGKGWLLRTWADLWSIRGTGLEVNPHFIDEARMNAESEGVVDRLEFIEGPALGFDARNAVYDLVLCIGATFAIGTFDDALAWMRRALRPGGALAIGDVFLSENPPAEVRSREKIPSDLRDLAGTIAAIEEQGLELCGLITSTTDDWDHYYSRWWRAAREWAHEHPGHPDRDYLQARVAAGRRDYLAWERRYLGWGIFVARPRSS